MTWYVQTVMLSEHRKEDWAQEENMQFKKFNKIPRLSRDILITEKIDGTNASVLIINSSDFYSWFENNSEAYKADAEDFFQQYCLAVDSKTEREFDLYLFAGSRTRWITPDKDNYGFARWVKENAEELFKLGEGQHFGEWYGQGIQRKYGLQEKRWALFNVHKWAPHEVLINGLLCRCSELKEGDKRQFPPACCGVVPILYTGEFKTDKIEYVLNLLAIEGSHAVPGFKDPEGIVIFHKASGQLFKKTIKDDEKPKGQTE